MNRLTSIFCVTIAIFAGLLFTGDAQSPTELPPSPTTKATSPDRAQGMKAYYPKMRLGHLPGTYLTIEGVVGKDFKGGQPILSVETVNGKPLAKPVSIFVLNTRLPIGERCILKGYENGKMIGRPPAERAAAKEQGKELPPDQTAWRWETYFTALIAVEPDSIRLDE